jgi:integrase
MANKNPQDRGIRCRNGVWYAYIGVNKKSKEVHVGPNKNDAIALRSQLKLMSLAGTLQAFLKKQEPQPVFTYAEAVKEHDEKHLKYQISSYDLLGRLNPSKALFENHDITKIQWQEIENYRNSRLSEVCPATVKQELDMIHAVFNRQVKNGRLQRNPLDMVDRPKFNNTREEIISHEEFLKLLNLTWEVDDRGFKTTKAIEPYLKLALVIADFTAMRIGEVLNIKWKHIRENGGNEEIYIPKTKTQVKRFVPIHPELSRILHSRPRRGSYVVNFKGKKILDLRKGFTKARELVGLSWLHMHDFRHRAITRWVQQGHPINVIMKATGHRTFSAFSRYANLKEGDIQVLVGRKTQPLPIVTYQEYLGIKVENMAKTWQAA